MSDKPTGEPQRVPSATRATRRAERLARRLAALPEPAMRQAVLAESLAEGDPAGQCAVLAEIVRRGRAGGPPFYLALLALGGVLGDPAAVPYERRAALYAAAREAALLDLADLFLSSATPGEAEAPAPLSPDGRPLTLGERKSLARGRRREVLERLLRDPAAPVIRILLANPRLCEADVIAIAARRPQLPEVQEEIARARRWIGRYHVKLALVVNPHTPSNLAIRLLGFLHAADLRQVADEPTLSEAVRQAARRRLGSRTD